MDPIPDEVMPRFRQIPKVKEKSAENVYVVRLTEEERKDAIKYLAYCRDAYSLARLCGSVVTRLQSARPEHSERQEALELVAKAARRAALVMSDPGTRLLLGALDRLESLEGK